jgi:Uma2 family endonuclease
MIVRIRHPEKLIYPESDDQPMGENTLQFQWIITLFHGFENLYFERPDVFVSSDLFWYPVEGDPTTVLAADLMIVFGRPKGHRGSYKQWEEGGVAPQVVIEIQSPSNTTRNSARKRAFYRRYGVQEFYEYDPDTGVFLAWQRDGRKLVPVPDPNGMTSPLLGVRFEVSREGILSVIRPDGRPFLSYRDMIMEAERHQEQLLQERLRAERERLKADQERLKADQERLKAEKLAARLRELGIDPESVS